MTRGIVDTGPLVGYLDADDQWHSWSVRTLNQVDDVLHTSEGVVAEACFRLRKQKPAVSSLLSWIKAGGLQVLPIVADHASELDTLLQKYPDMDLCDATIVRLSELWRDSRVITIDQRHFTIYRRHRNQEIPLLYPP